MFFNSLSDGINFTTSLSKACPETMEKVDGRVETDGSI